MKIDQRTNVTGLLLPRRALQALRERGIFAQPSVGLNYQQLAKRYVVRGVESGGAAGDVGCYVSFAQEDGRAVQCLHPVESIGVNGPHSVVVAPVLIRLDMRTCCAKDAHTSCSLPDISRVRARYRRREREIVMEAFPEFAAVTLLETCTRYEVSWRAIFELAAEIRARKERERKGEER